MSPFERRQRLVEEVRAELARIERVVGDLRGSYEAFRERILLGTRRREEAWQRHVDERQR